MNLQRINQRIYEWMSEVLVFSRENSDKREDTESILY